MIVFNSLRQLMRTPVKTLAFLILLILAVAFFMLGFQLWSAAMDNIARIDEAYTTIGTVEQKGTGVRIAQSWDAATKSYTYFNGVSYNGIIPESVLDFEGADYIIPPQKRPCYGAYMPGFVMSKEPYWEFLFDHSLLIVELQPLEDCVTTDPVCMKVKRVLCGKLEYYIDEIWFCDHFNDTPVKFYADKTYVMSLQEDCFHIDTDKGYIYMPAPGLTTSQRDSNDNRINGLISSEDSWDSTWDEVTDGFYETPIGRAWLNLIASVDYRKYTVPVVPTQSTKLLMPFFDGKAWIDEGRDINREEYEKGEKVCLVDKNFADNNNLSVGDSLVLPLFYSNYYSSPRYAANVGSLLNANGEVYGVFDESAYTIVGMIGTMTTETMETTDYDAAQNMVVIPSASVKSSDENNIIYIGPMKGYTTSFQIKNGHIDEYMAAWGKQGISELEINFFDKGYTKIKAGLDDMMNTASILLIAGAGITLLILILFCHLLITKQRKRTAIERSLGLSTKGCVVSLLTGILVIVIPACVIGSAISYWLCDYAAERVTTAQNEQAYETMYSDWVNSADADAQAFTVSMDNGLSNVWLGLGVVPVAVLVALINIRGNLQSEPLKLLGEKER